MIYALLFITSFFLTYFIKNYAIKKSLVAEVNERSSHSVPTPHGGGIAIAITWFGGLSYLYFTQAINQELFFALLLGIVLCIISYIDDLIDLSSKIRLLTQAFVSACGILLLGGLESLNLGMWEITNMFVTNIFAFFLAMWFINLYNFLDGIDGYAGSEAIFLAVAGFILFGGEHFLVLAVAVFGFLLWNWHKAKIFMGDVGSTLLGYNIAIFTIYYTNIESMNLWIWIVLFGVFWFDATLTLLRRYQNKERLSQAHKKHAYQRLTQAQWSHDKVVMTSIALNILLFCLVYFITNIFIAFFVSIILLYGATLFIDSKKQFQKS